jgi:nucleotide-binding universal stress UspA family protein
MFDVKTILYATDFHEASLAAFDVAKSIAAKFDARIVALHVAMTPAEYSNWATVLPVDAEVLAHCGDELANFNREDGGEIERLVFVGDAETEIVREAEERRCNLIVMGTTGRGGIGRLLLGSVAEHVSRKAHCPVLLVRADAAERSTEAKSLVGAAR